MVAKIPPQSPALTGQNGTDALLNSERIAQSYTGTKTPKKMDKSYELNLSEAAKSQMASPLTEVNNREEARSQMDFIKSAAEKSTAIMLSAQKPNAKSVVDLLA